MSILSKIKSIFLIKRKKEILLNNEQNNQYIYNIQKSIFEKFLHMQRDILKYLKYMTVNDLNSFIHEEKNVEMSFTEHLDAFLFFFDITNCYKDELDEILKMRKSKMETKDGR